MTQRVLISLFVVSCVFVCSSFGSVIPGVSHAGGWTGTLAGTAMGLSEDITSPGDPVIGVPDDDAWPPGEAPRYAIDDNINTKYLHFGGQDYPTGIIISPSIGATVVQELRFTTANDAPERDPVAYEFYGSNAGTGGPWTLIAAGSIEDFQQAAEWPRWTPNATPIVFANSTAYRHYRLMFTAVRRPWRANSMQIGEIELVKVEPGGQPPQVDAGPDQVLVLPRTRVQLQGTVTDDGVDSQGEPLTMEWTLEEAPAGVMAEDVQFLPDALGEQPEVELPAVRGTYRFRLTASDGFSTAYDAMQVTLSESLCPTADLNGDCGVDLADLEIMAADWLAQDLPLYDPAGDIDGRDGVNLADYAYLAQNWQAEGPGVLITEIVALNNTKPPLEPGDLVDEDNESSDWIELFNASPAPMHLDGWVLTEDPEDLNGWVFPDVVIESGEFLVVFASGKDRDDPEAELHTDFSLSGEGGWLGLVKPDGMVAHAISYAAQFANVGFGLASPNGGAGDQEIELVPAYASAQALIPEDGTLGRTWVSPEFSAAGWRVGTTGVGYDYGELIGLDVSDMYGSRESVYIRIPFEVDDLSNVQELLLDMKYDDGFVAYLNDERVIASANAPEDPDWTSHATGKHDDDVAVEFVRYRLPEEALGSLRVGGNVLAIHGLNESATSTDLLILPRLVAVRRRPVDLNSAVLAYFPIPTPGSANHSGIEDLGPAVREVTENPPPPTAEEDLVITARVEATHNPVASAALHYRIGFGGELEVAMNDAGVDPDAAAGDGVYSARIPASAYGAGEMVRWYVTAVDAMGQSTREPLFLLPERSPEYFGTVVQNPTINTNLNVFQYFVQNTAAEGTRTGTRASVFYLDEFYDNVFVRLRGGNTTHGRKFDFNNGRYFRFMPGGPRADEINLNETGNDPTYVRQVLSWETYERAGQPASVSFPLHVRRNGSYLDIRIFVEQPDSRLIEREGLDPRGALYKVYSDLSRLAGEQAPRKSTRLFEDLSDLQALIDGVSPSNPNRREYVMDNVNVPAVVNFLAASVLIHENDHTHKNYFLYRDTEGSGEWLFLPWDKDLTFGINNGIAGVIADQDWPGDPLRSPSHPFFGDSTHQKIDYQWNRLFDAIHANPVTREMYLRRLRTLMDQILQPSSTPAAERFYENRVDELAASYEPEKGTSLSYQTGRIKTEYLPVRRQHFYVNHNVGNPSYPDNAGIPGGQPANAVVQFGVIEFNPASANQDEEYIELTNPNGYAVDVSGWEIAGGVEHRFQPGTVVPAGRSMYVSPSVRAFRSRGESPRGGEQRFVQGNYSGHLSNWGETLELFDDTGRLVDTTTYEGDPSDAQRFLRISELMYHPTDPAAGEPYTDEDFEYVELLNIGGEPLSLEGVKFVDAIVYSFAADAMIPAGGYAILAKNPDAFAQRYTVPAETVVLGPYEGAFSNGGERIKLEDITNSTILEFEYKDGWYDITDGRGFSLTVIDPLNPNLDSWDDKAAWRSSTYAGGSPGTADSGAAPGSIVISEVMAHSHQMQPDWVELHNTTGQAVSIGGWFLSDSNADDPNAMKYQIDPDVEIGAGGYVVFYEDVHFGAFATGPGIRNTPFALSEAGETVYLQSSENGQLTGYVAEQKFDASETGVSMGLYQSETMTEAEFTAMAAATPGEANSGPKLDRVVISEIMYHPADGDSGGEYLELHNISGAPLTLAREVSTETAPGVIEIETVGWKFTDGIEFSFPADVPVTIPAGGYIVVAEDPAAFAAWYGDVGAAVMGPFEQGTNLSNGGERVELSMPGDQEFGEARYYIRIDSVKYGDNVPWPLEADGEGAVLSREPRISFGDDPANWTAADPGPGQ